MGGAATIKNSLKTRRDHMFEHLNGPRSLLESQFAPILDHFRVHRRSSTTQNDANGMAGDPDLGLGVHLGHSEGCKPGMKLEGKNRRWRQEQREHRVSVTVKVPAATTMLEADAKPDSREHCGCKVWRVMA